MLLSGEFQVLRSWKHRYTHPDRENDAVTFADDTTEQRARAGGRSPFVVVEAGYTGLVDQPWVHNLRAEARGIVPLKWSAVQGFVTSGTGSGAAAARSGLSSATIVIVDPMALLREADVAWVLGSGLPPMAHWYDHPGLRDLRRRIDHLVGEDLLALSGAARILDVLSGPLELVDLGDGRRRANPTKLSQQLGGSLKKVSLLAAKTTTLMAHEDDPDTADALFAGVAPLVATLRYASGDGLLNRVRLEALAGRRVVFDEGQADVVNVVADLQRQAHQRLDLYAPYLGLRAPHDGFVRSADDRDELRLQIADVAAGWARDILQTHGLFELGKTFRLVMYNGAQLDPDEARRTDEERSLHQRLLASAVRL